MMHRIAVLVLLALVPVIANAQKTRALDTGAQFIGYKFKEGVTLPNLLPNGVKYLGGGLIGDINADPVYGISQTEKGRLKMFWLKVSIGQDATGVTGWKVLDVLSFQNVLKTEYLVLAGDPSVNCTKDSQEIPNLVGRGRIARSKDSFVPTRLWVADIAKRKFVPFAVTGVKCEYSEP